MAATKYTYNLDHYINTTRLAQNIANSAIVIALDYINSTGMTYDVWMKDALSSGDETILDNLVATCSNDPLPYQPQGVALQTPAGVNVPVVSDVPVMLPNLFPAGVVLDLIGAGDDIANNVRGDGPRFNMAAGDAPVEWQYLDWVMLAGGGLNSDSALRGDCVDMTVSAPASTVTAASGGNTGNCNLVDPGVGAAIMIVPAPGNGTHNVDLTTAVPVPAPYDGAVYSGYWNWSDPPTGSGTITAGDGFSWWNLFTVAIPLTSYATRFQLLGTKSTNLTLPAVKPGKILPQWKSKVALTAVNGSTVQVCWYMITARMRTI